MARAIYVAAVASLIAVYYLVPGARTGAVAAIAAMSVAGIVASVARRRPQRWGAWLLIAATVALLAVGDVIFSLLADRSGVVAYPGVPEVFFLLAYVPLAVGLMWLGRPAFPSRELTMMVDVAILSLAGTLLVWMLLVHPAVTSQHLTGGAKLTAVASWVGLVAVLAASARVVLIWRTNAAAALLAAAMVCYLTADFLYGRALLDGSWTVGGLVDLGFLGFVALCGVAALTPSMASLGAAEYTGQQFGFTRLALLALALLVAPTALLVQATSGSVATGVAIAVVSAAIAMLMLVRIWLAARGHRWRGRRDRAFGAGSRALVTATTEHEVLTGLRAAMEAMLPDGTPCEVRLFGPGGDAGVLGPSLRLVSATHDDGRTREVWVLSVPVLGPSQALVFTAPTAELVEFAPALRLLADQAGSALDRIRLMARVRADDRERYFRTLVLTSTDVTMITRAGIIEYATPSARAMFGRDVTGERFDDLVRHDPAARPVGGTAPAWSDTEDGVEAYATAVDGGTLTMLMHRRDLSRDPTVSGVVTTLRDVTAERALQRELAYRASHDALTGLANAKLFDDELTHDSYTDAERRGAPGGGRAALFIDLDDFKSINDTYGHEFGDRLLVEVALRIQSCLRETDIAARLGGDEFAVLLRGVPDAAAARGLAQRVADALAPPVVLDGISVIGQASIGLAYAPSPGEAQSLLREADAALYTAKAKGKGRWWQYRDDMPTPPRRRRARRGVVDRSAPKIEAAPGDRR